MTALKRQAEFCGLGKWQKRVDRADLKEVFLLSAFVCAGEDLRYGVKKKFL